LKYNGLLDNEVHTGLGLVPAKPRVFGAEMKTTPAKFVESLRLEAARRRLQESNASLGSVAATCGFRNCDAMRSTFKRVLRVAPGE
jgi:transcriptional regulator GlxA family with amidase domain